MSKYAISDYLSLIPACASLAGAITGVVTDNKMLNGLSTAALGPSIWYFFHRNPRLDDYLAKLDKPLPHYLAKLNKHLPFKKKVKTSKLEMELAQTPNKEVFQNG